MFSGLQIPLETRESNWLRRNRFALASTLAHLAVLALIVLRNPRIVTLQPTWLAWGDSTHTSQITYIPSGNAENPLGEAKLLLPSENVAPKHQLQPQTRHPKRADRHRQPEPQAEEADENAKAGSPLGTVVDGPIVGHEVHIAYPVVFPDPPVNRAELPRDLVGDVVIEVTIDAQGNVVETKIVQAIGHGIDERIEATLRRWHYQPATLDGTPVASHHDVHFHFPS
jgi:TonB family protein